MIRQGRIVLEHVGKVLPNHPAFRRSGIVLLPGVLEDVEQVRVSVPRDAIGLSAPHTLEGVPGLDHVLEVDAVVAPPHRY